MIWHIHELNLWKIDFVLVNLEISVFDNSIDNNNNDQRTAHCSEKKSLQHQWHFGFHRVNNKESTNSLIQLVSIVSDTWYGESRAADCENQRDDGCGFLVRVGDDQHERSFTSKSWKKELVLKVLLPLTRYGEKLEIDLCRNWEWKDLINSKKKPHVTSTIEYLPNRGRR